MAGRPRKLLLLCVLELVRGQTVTALISEAVQRFHVSYRLVEQALSMLEWGGFIIRPRSQDGDKRVRTVCLTERGTMALSDPVVGFDLILLPVRYRERGSESLEVPDASAIRAKAEAWRVEMWR